MISTAAAAAAAVAGELTPGWRHSIPTHRAAALVLKVRAMSAHRAPHTGRPCVEQGGTYLQSEARFPTVCSATYATLRTRLAATDPVTHRKKIAVTFGT